MRHQAFLTGLTLALLVGVAALSHAQVKQVQMHIDGYLCGN
jgi:hypothetical protein